MDMPKYRILKSLIARGSNKRGGVKEIYNVLHKNKFCKNSKAQNRPNFKNRLRIMQGSSFIKT